MVSEETQQRIEGAEKTTPRTYEGKIVYVVVGAVGLNHEDSGVETEDHAKESRNHHDPHDQDGHRALPAHGHWNSRAAVAVADDDESMTRLSGAGRTLEVF